MKRFWGKNREAPVTAVDVPVAPDDGPTEEALQATEKSTWERIWPVLACGSGLFSDGYLNNVISSVSQMLGNIYHGAYTNSSAKKNISSLVFAGTVVGMLFFGYTSDKWGRKNSLLASTTVLFVFAALAAGSYGAGGSTGGLFAALTAYRFLLGIGIGGEYPAGSVGASEASGEVKEGQRNTWFIMFTNVAIDWGFVIGAFVPYVIICITGEGYQHVAWRLCLGLGVIPPMILFFLRLKLTEPEEFSRESMKHVRIPYWLVFKFYGFRLAVVSLIWFLYDFSNYAFGIYSPTIIATIIPDSSLATQFGWNTVINLFYIPGAMLGGPFSDWIGPQYALAVGVTAQAIVGYIMAALYGTLSKAGNIGAFCTVYGIFLTLGELGPGDNIGLVASKTSATGIRGQYYGIAAAFGKIGAFVGTYAFPSIEALGGDNIVKRNQYPFWVASSLCILSALLATFCLPRIRQDTITYEDARFRTYLESKGWDTRQLGLLEGQTVAERVISDESGEKI
ncbi:MAG: hypothetical protein M1818_006013 [Claussenomyces sp. TS43310]|nr:MAG: hypothetical protein M1818_006013 [Claussenomyces sp. TS43310]